MYERFTDRARKVMKLANREAQRFNYEYIGTEDVLLGLVKEWSGVAAEVLKNLNIDQRDVRMMIERGLISGKDMVTFGKLPKTPRATKVIEFTIEESNDLGHGFVGTEHLLLGLLRETEGVAGRVLRDLGLTAEIVRQEVLNVLGRGYEQFGESKPRISPVQPGWASSLGKNVSKLLAKLRGQDETEKRA